jgi:hypothetical protein
MPYWDHEKKQPEKAAFFRGPLGCLSIGESSPQTPPVASLLRGFDTLQSQCLYCFGSLGPLSTGGPFPPDPLAQQAALH